MNEGRISEQRDIAKCGRVSVQLRAQYRRLTRIQLVTTRQWAVVMIRSSEIGKRARQVD